VLVLTTASSAEMGTFVHAVENEMLCASTNEKVRSAHSSLLHNVLTSPADSLLQCTHLVSIAPVSSPAILESAAHSLENKSAIGKVDECVPQLLVCSEAWS
jgi:hypothetical protein